MESEVTKNDVIKLIEVRKDDSLNNHLKCLFLNKRIPMGEVGSSTVKIWNPNIWNGAFYPIFEFKFNSDDHLIKISDRINPASKFYFSIIAIALISLLISPIFSGFKIPGSLYYILFVSFFLLLLFYVFYKKYQFERNNQLEQIFEILDIETQKEAAISEWSLKNLITRIFLYSFSIGLILLSIFYLIPNENFILGIGCFIFFGIYLYIDLKILFRAS